jgi:hypothetical protein
VTIIVRLFWALCLAGATYEHLQPLIAHGWGYQFPGIPPASMVFWKTLTFLDPLAIILIFILPRAGILLLLAIMLSDVAHNAWILAFHGGAASNLILQAIFLVIVLITAPFVWKFAAP